MKEICNIAECTGCMACVNVCTHNAIQVKPDHEGFDRPVIDGGRCVDCGLCAKTCPINHHPLCNEPQKVYSGWSVDEAVRLGSSSGGAFTEIARPVLESGGVVFGCTLNEELQAEHTYVESMDELTLRLSGSKYVQSRIGDSYTKAKDFLRQGRKVLFCGTPCQIAGLRNYLKKDYDNLITVDLICHGVPSPLVFEEYKKYISKTEKMVLTDVKFRCKNSSWIFFNMTITGHVEKSCTEKKYIGDYFSDPYIIGFLRDYILRPSCHRCHFTSTKRCSDFTIADWWGYKKISDVDNGYEQKGVSLILCNTDTAISLSRQLKMEWRERTLEEAKRTNTSLSHPFSMPPIRSEFWKDYASMNFQELKKKYMEPEKLPLSMIFMLKMNDTFYRKILIFVTHKFEGVMRKLKIQNKILFTYKP